MTNLKKISTEELIFNIIYTEASWVKFIIISIVFSLILSMGYELDIQPQLQQLHSLSVKTIDLHKDLIQKQLLASHLDEYQKQLQAARQRFASIVTGISATLEISALLEIISKIGVTAGLEFNYLKPQSEQHTVLFTQLPIELEVKGSFSQIMEFIDRISAINSVIIPQDFSITPQKLISQEQDKKSFELVMNIKLIANYINNKPLVPNKKKIFSDALLTPDRVNKLRNPFQAKITPWLDEKSPLEAFSLDALTMVGIIKQGAVIWALIMTPDNKVYKVTTGSHLGQNDGRVTKISTNQIEVIEQLPQGSRSIMLTMR